MPTSPRKKYRVRLIMRQPIYDKKRALVDYAWDSCEAELSTMLAHGTVVGAEIIEEIGEDAQPALVIDVATEAVLQRPIGDLDLSVRAFNRLVGAGIKTIGDLAAIHPVALKKYKGFGNTIVDECAKALEGVGLRLGVG